MVTTAPGSSVSLTVAVLVGSLRRASTTRRLADVLVAAAPEGVACGVVGIGDLPLYDEDLDVDQPPVPWARFRADVLAHDAVLFVTPEYNRSVPAPLKNAVDVGSAPHDRSVWAGKPAGVVSASPGRLGAFGANHHLRQSLVFLDVPTMQQPELYLSDTGEHLPEGAAPSAEVVARASAYMAALAQWCRRHAPVAA